MRVRRNAVFDNSGGIGGRISRYQREGPGFRAYKWVRNLKGDDGNYYAEHVSVTGQKHKVYSLSEQKEFDDRHSLKWICYQCQHESDNGISGMQNKCQNCGVERYIGYYG